MALLIPDRLRAGDSVAIVSPSWGGPNTFPHVYENGIKVLKDWGLNIVEYPTARAADKFLHANPQLRAKDINDAFADKNIKAIFASIGGDDSVRILPYLNKDITRQNPKIITGFSDTTTLLTFCNQLGLLTFHGPAVMAGYSQIQNEPAAFAEHVYQMFFQPTDNYDYKSYNQFCDGYPEWAIKENVGRTNAFVPDDGWRFLQGSGIVQGALFGGCIEVLEFLKSTDFWPDKSFWYNKILFLETSEDKPSVTQVKYMLRNYGSQGIFEKLSALLFGRAKSYSFKEKQQLDEMVKMVVANEFSCPDLPIISNMDFGHTDPQFVLPLGVKAEVNCADKTFRLVEQWLN